MKIENVEIIFDQ